jgi:hypothetical protein
MKNRHDAVRPGFPPLTRATIMLDLIDGVLADCEYRTRPIWVRRQRAGAPHADSGRSSSRTSTMTDHFESTSLRDVRR